MKFIEIRIGHVACQLLRRARIYWGRQHEINMAMEELAETITALNHLSRGRLKSKEEFLEEFADAIVCCCQVVENEHWWDELAVYLSSSLCKIEKKLLSNDRNYKEPK